MNFLVIFPFFPHLHVMDLHNLPFKCICLQVQGFYLFMHSYLREEISIYVVSTVSIYYL